jgi:deoxyribose-phosphate aldolase
MRGRGICIRSWSKFDVFLCCLLLFGYLWEALFGTFLCKTRSIAKQRSWKPSSAVHSRYWENAFTNPHIRDTTLSLQSGASELDTVMNATHLLAGSYSAIYTELAGLRSAAPNALLKVIFETSRLTPDQIVAACVLSAAASFDYVKTSTGFLAADDCIVGSSGERKPTGATKEDVQLMKACCEYLGSEESALGSVVKRKMKVKASGGVRTLVDAVVMIEAGADRLGSSGGVWIAKEGEAAKEGKGGMDGERPKGVETRMFSDY